MYQVGDLIAGYRVLDVLGRGGMGDVYKAAHPRLPRSDALKVLRSGHATDPVFRARFEREADIVAPLHHPNVVTVYDRGVFEGQLWIAMEYVPGVDVARMLAADAPLDPRLACTIVRGVAAGLDAAHRRGIMHRDIKPANILVTPGLGGDRPGNTGSLTPEAVKVTDFGIAQVLDEVTNLTGTGITIGTMHYASPEQIEGRRVDPRSDIYSLGATAFELLTGAPPFDATSLHGLMTAHMYHEPPPASSRNGALPAAVDAVLARAMAKNPDDRYPTAGEFADALHDAFDTRQTLVGPRMQPDPHASPGSSGSAPGMPAAGDPTSSAAYRDRATDPTARERLGPPMVSTETLHGWEPTHAAEPARPVRRGGGATVVAIGAAVALIAGILGAGAGFVSTSAGTLETPNAPDAEVTTTAVELSWGHVDDATDYVVTQNHEVIYSGPDTKFTAPRPIPGTYTYQVAAQDEDGRTSEFSRNSEAVDVFMTWGELQPIADLYHDLVPASPLSTNGFDGMRCWGEDGDLAFESSKRTVWCTRYRDDEAKNADYQVIVDVYDTPEEARAAADVTAYNLRGTGYTTAQGFTGTLYLSDKQRDQGQAILAHDTGDRAKSVVWVVVPGKPAAAAADLLKRLPI
ncbi:MULTISPECIES: serine/threonine-protein kinase [Gordonia]|uniref:non-specific serine/threonine protein kinase n=1 Tax=Gordonia amicalis TaxID=89053 RepID=A0AAE4R6J8_9ACTN|nr:MULTISPECIES: serine/threonine-protein kinase [Gordonia]ATD73239.1 serine/threonine protein kinase [Gordonia sp. 1D]KAF0969265.1 Serine/threonine-protein kinase PknD [Gordonia sp. YY1]MCR8895762.1 serine/threonine protein kinase [Gordonia sp. GONU]MDJ0454509.1 serine/threonine-protein kinase [Gordonia amicalis]MDV6308588.1 serine/threonine-protein kinase [Gordonia amicalis]